VSAVLADDGVAEHNLYFSIGGPGGVGVIRGLTVCPGDIVLELAHQDKKTGDADGPCHQYAQKQQLIGGHIQKCRRA
jgi:hypothetical protein